MVCRPHTFPEPAQLSEDTNPRQQPLPHLPRYPAIKHLLVCIHSFVCLSDNPTNTHFLCKKNLPHIKPYLPRCIHTLSLATKSWNLELTLELGGADPQSHATLKRSLRRTQKISETRCKAQEKLVTPKNSSLRRIHRTDKYRVRAVEEPKVWQLIVPKTELAAIYLVPGAA